MMLEGISQQCVWSHVPSSSPSHKLKIQEVSPEAVSERGGNLRTISSQLNRDVALQIAVASLWIPVVCSGKETT